MIYALALAGVLITGGIVAVLFLQRFIDSHFHPED